MYEDYEDTSAGSAEEQHTLPPVRQHDQGTQRESMNRWEFRADQVRMLYQQVQTELIISVVMAAIVCAVFWNLVPPTLLLTWCIASTVSVGARSLFISGSHAEENQDAISGWGKHYVAGVMVSGACWGSLGIMAAVYGELIHQAFTLFVLAGVSLSAYVSMQPSPRAIASFLAPALLPTTAWFIYEGSTYSIALGAITIVFAMVMLFSSHNIRKILAKHLSLGSHNTELINKLVTARKAAQRAKRSAEKANEGLQDEMKERQAAEDRIRASEQRMTAILDSMQDTIYQTDNDGKILWATPSIQDLVGYDLEKIIGSNIKDWYVTASDHDHFMRALDENCGRMQHFESRLLHKSGDHRWISENSQYRRNERGKIIGIEGTIRDITPMKHAKDALQQEKERAQVTLSSIGDGVITTDLDGNIEYMNTVAEQSTGWKLESARGRSINKVLKIIDEKTLEPPPNPVGLCLENGSNSMLAGHLLLVHRHRKQRLSIEVNASPIRDSNSDITGVVLVFHDVTELRGLTKKMSYQATHDSLTGLINRREFESRIKQAIENTRNSDVRHALCYMDLDNFKVVNDTCGHTAGDELLKQLTIKLRMELREADTLARLGGDEFGILLEGCSMENAIEPAEAIRRIVEQFRFVWDNKAFRIGASIGLVPITADSGTLTDILSAADSACYVAKDNGRNRIHAYQPNDEVIAERHGQMQWVQRIQNVLEQNRFRLFFQPTAKLNRKPGENITTHGEVLIRILDESNGIVGPGSFIPSAERYCLMPTIDRWVVSNTLKMLALDVDGVVQRISSCCINLSGQSLSDERFMDFLIGEINNSGVPPEILCFEITETAVIANLCNATTLISTLREMGCRFSLDDFGVGLSSFGYLKNLPVDYLKLDGCFIKNMVSDDIDHAMVEAINQIGHTMGIKTIAEYVEDMETLRAVRNIGIDYAQGYVLSRPVPMEIGLYNDPIDISTLLGDREEAVKLKSVSGKKS